MSKTRPIEGWAVNRGLRIHYLDSNPVGSQGLTPLVYVPGALNAADGLIPEMEALAPRRCVSMALRGRGKSDAPMSGYTFDENVSDVEAVVDSLRLKGAGHNVSQPDFKAFVEVLKGFLTGLDGMSVLDGGL